MGYRLTSTLIPKGAPKQIYEQVISHEKSVVGDQRNNNVGLDAREQMETRQSEGQLYPPPQNGNGAASKFKAQTGGLQL